MKIWTDDDHKKIEAMLAQGLSWAEIAESMGVTRNAIAGKVYRLGLLKEPGKNASRHRKRNIPRVWDTNHGNWDTRTFLPYAEWKLWNRNRKKETEDA